MNKIYSFDAFRFILALCVVFGHSYVVLFRQGPSLIGVQNIAVDGFFILSGFLMALSLSRNKEKDNDISNVFLAAQKKRFCRLWPEFFFALLVCFLLKGIFFNKFDWYAIPFNLALITQVDKFPWIVNGSWYISVLFWAGALVSYILLSGKKRSISFYLPLIIFLCLGYIYPTFTHLSLHGTNHFLFDAYSMGFIKGIMDMSIGIECYFISKYFAKNKSKIREKYRPYIIRFFEILGLFLMLYAWTAKGVDKNNFLVLFGYIILVIILSLHKETFLKFLSWKMWRPLAPTAYMIFLTHCAWLEIIKKYVSYKNYPETFVYITVVMFCCVFGFVCYYTQKYLFAKIKAFLFDDNAPILENIKTADAVTGPIKSNAETK